jgi:hypothetical protein
LGKLEKKRHMKNRLFLLTGLAALFAFECFALALRAGQPEALLWGSLALASFALAWLLALPLFPKG